MEVPLCIGTAMGQVVSCSPRGTCYQYCFVSTVVACSVGEAVVVDIVVVEALALRAHVLTDKGVILLVADLLKLLFLVQSAAT
jgi:hypothetical protein